MRAHPLFSLIAALAISPTPLAAQTTEEKAAACTACHGPAGNSSNPEWPNIAGQHASYTLRQLQAFKSGERDNPLMSGIAAGLSEADMRELAAYFAGLEPMVGSADPALVDRGEAIYRGGDRADGVPACMGCHGPRGTGNPPAAYPALSGQHATYTAKQLRAYRTGERTTDPDSIMRTIAARLSDEEIEAVASYTAGLH